MQAKTKQQTETVRAALLALDDAQLQRVVQHLCPFTPAGEQLRKLLGYQALSLMTATRYETEAELSAAEPKAPFTFVVPAITAVRALLAMEPTEQIHPTLQAMSGKTPRIKNGAWDARLVAALPDLASAPLAPLPPPVVNPTLDEALLATALKQAVEARKDSIIASLSAAIATMFSRGMKYTISHEYDPPWDHSGTAQKTEVPLFVEDYLTVEDFLEEYDGNTTASYESGMGLYHDTYSKRFDMAIRAELATCYPQAIIWLKRENPTYYHDMLAYLRYYGELDAADAPNNVIDALFMQDIGCNATTDCEIAAYKWVNERRFAAILSASDLPIERSRRRIAEQAQLTALLQDVTTYCYSTAIVTFTSPADLRPLVMDINRDGDTIHYGYAPYHQDLLTTKLLQGGAIILRSFLEEIDPANGLPIKELRGWAILQEDGQVQTQRLLADDLYWAMNTDSQTGERLNAEPDVRYC